MYIQLAVALLLLILGLITGGVIKIKKS